MRVLKLGGVRADVRTGTEEEVGEGGEEEARREEEADREGAVAVAPVRRAMAAQSVPGMSRSSGGRRDLMRSE
jgi:hypothetical protein